MSKVTEYLSEHVLGEVSTRPSVLAAYSSDGSVLKTRPEMVVFPRTVSDLRKIATFCWQLAEKGHVLALTPRGGGTGLNGGAIGRGIVINTTTHMHQLFEVEAKQGLVRLQPGTTVGTLLSTLSLQGATISAFRDSDRGATIGGAVAEGFSGTRQNKHGAVNDAVSQLEIVLANGELIQTGRLSKREVSRKKGLETFEGDIYRKLDVLFEDNAEFFASMAKNRPVARAGYPGIFDVREKNGSFDLTPLFVGSQGTLGIIGEAILKTNYASDTDALAVLVFSDKTTARDSTKQFRKLDPSFAEYIDGELVNKAIKNGKQYDEIGGAAAVIVLGFDETSDKGRAKKLKKTQKLFTSEGVDVITSDNGRIDRLQAIRDIVTSAHTSAPGDESFPPLVDNFYVPEERFEEFVEALEGLAKKHRVELPLYGDMLSGIYSTRPLLFLRRVGDKQKVFKLIDEIGALVAHCGGTLVGDGSEGRLQAKAALKQLDLELQKLYQSVKEIFDPFNILNPGVKQDPELRDLVSMLRSEY